MKQCTFLFFKQQTDNTLTNNEMENNLTASVCWITSRRIWSLIWPQEISWKFLFPQSSRTPQLFPLPKPKSNDYCTRLWLYILKFVILGTERLFTSEHLIAKIAGSTQLIFCALKKTFFSKVLYYCLDCANWWWKVDWFGKQTNPDTSKFTLFNCTDFRFSFYTQSF